jgi:hypothetical protein
MPEHIARHRNANAVICAKSLSFIMFVLVFSLCFQEFSQTLFVHS